MAVTPADIEHIAALARLRLEPQEVDRLTGQLNDILGHFAALQSIDVRDVPPFAVAAEGAAPLRADVPGADPLHVDPAVNAPAWRAGFFTVPRLAAQRRSADSPAEDTAAAGDE
jgi:aspartyl/glutamyl-tRNA(Asn/Gln) amidotransferase C subunit